MSTNLNKLLVVWHGQLHESVTKANDAGKVVEKREAAVMSFETPLSGQTCAELITKILQQNLLPGLLTTLDGKEYVTPARLDSEIEDTVLSKGGRVNVVDLQSVLNIDFRYIEARARLLLDRKQDAWVITYFEKMDMEINRVLADAGWVSIGTLCQKFHLSLQFLQKHIEKRVEKAINGRTDPSFPGIVFTDRYAVELKTIIADLINGLSSPIQVSTIQTQNNLPEPLFYPLLESLIKEGGFFGSFKGRREKAVYTPNSFKTAQSDSAKAFVRQNGYIGTLAEFISTFRHSQFIFLLHVHTKVQRVLKFPLNGFSEYYNIIKLEIDDPPRDFLKREFPSILLLDTCAVTQSVVATVEASVEEVVQNDSWLDITLERQLVNIHDAEHTSFSSCTLSQHLAPSCFTDADVSALLRSLPILKSRPQLSKSSSTATADHSPMILASYVTTTGFIQQCTVAMRLYLQKKASGVVQANSRDDAKRSEGGDAADEEGSVAVTKKVKGGGRPSVKDGKRKKDLKGKVGAGDDESDGISQGEISFQLSLVFQDLDTDLRDLIAARLIKQLTEEYSQILKSVYLPAIPAEELDEAGDRTRSAERKRRMEELAGRANEAWCHIRLYTKGLAVFEGGTCRYTSSEPVTLFAFICVDNNVRASLEKHLLRTICLELIDLVIVQQAFVHHLQQWVPSGDDDARANALATRVLTEEQLHQLVERLPEEVRGGLVKVRKSASNGKVGWERRKERCAVDRGGQEFVIIVDFMSNFEIHMGVLSHLPLRKIDKKVERQALHQIHVSLLTQLRAASASNAAFVLHLVSLLLFQSSYGVPLHASGKFVPKIVRQLEPALKQAGQQDRAAKLAALQVAIVGSMRGEGGPIDEAAVEEVRRFGLEAVAKEG
ncbi:hypothetical protein BC937DRAFT_93009 [Endogone sp. FLAS-F59071]|nr:hypothetical protein BC937DRAFT_93009 [Endogone sp. FLAS-F59071]|eukprot:RUS23054.1 hypothetical protein BC937DRAFT_93009 [Endogone sp. FLAS-F59071]